MCKKQISKISVSSIVALAISIFAITVGIALLLKVNSYSLKNETIEYIKDGKIVNDLVFFYKNNHVIIKEFSSALVSFGFTFLITILFVDLHNRKESKETLDKILQLQKDTAESAIYSVFNQIIDPDFFKVIKRDVIGCKVIRKDANWIYTITKEGDKLKLVRNISYTLHNLTDVEYSEDMKITFLETEYSTTKVKSVQKRYPGEDSFTNAESKPNQTVTEKGYKSEVREIKVGPLKSVEISSEIEQIYTMGDYLFDTHFLNNPLVGLTFTVNFPKDYSFKMNVDSLPEKPYRIPSSGNQEIWKFDGAILKGQGFDFVCSKNKTPKKN